MLAIVLREFPSLFRTIAYWIRFFLEKLFSLLYSSIWILYDKYHLYIADLICWFNKYCIVWSRYHCSNRKLYFLLYSSVISLIMWSTLHSLFFFIYCCPLDPLRWLPPICCWLNLQILNVFWWLFIPFYFRSERRPLLALSHNDATRLTMMMMEMMMMRWCHNGARATKLISISQQVLDVRVYI